MMPQKQTEEQKQANQILNRWLMYDLGWSSLAPLLVCAFGALLMRLGFNMGLPGLAVFVLAMCAMTAFFSRSALKRFVQKLTAEDKKNLQASLETEGSAKLQALARQILDASAQVKPSKVDSRAELLRASSPNQDDNTLLRAAAHVNETPQEELLRAKGREA